MDVRHKRETHDSIKVYTKAGLIVYDKLVMEVLAKQVWGCEPEHFLAHYRTHMTANHAEIGVGTGYCIDHCESDLPDRSLALVDLQKNCLEFAAKRLAAYAPTTYLRDVRRPIYIDAARFDSIALGGVLHCLPGDMRTKGKVFDALIPITKSGTTIFGYSLVADDVHTNRRRHLAHNCLNRLRVISNREDRFAELGHELKQRFANPDMHLIGSMAFFSAVVPTN